MAASTNDKFRLASGSTRPVVTSLALPKAFGAMTASLTSATGWNSTTGLDYVMYRRQLNTTTNKYEETPGTRIEGRATLSGTTLSGMTFDAGTEPASGYAADGNTVVLCAPTAQWADDMVGGLLVQHKQDGTHGDVTATSLVVTGPVTVPAGSITSSRVKLDIIDNPFNSGSTTDQQNTATTYTDITGSSFSYTAPAGNGVRLFLCAEFAAYTSANASVYILSVNGVTGGRAAYTELTSAVTLQAQGWFTVAAGATVTIKLQTKQLASGTGTIQSANNRAVELQPRITGFAISQ